MLPLALTAATLFALAACASPRTACEGSVSVALHANGRATLDGQSMALDEIVPAIAERHGEGGNPDCRVMVRADKDVIYRDVMSLMDALQRADYRPALVGEEATAPD